MSEFSEGSVVFYQAAYEPGASWKHGPIEDFVEASGVESEIQPGTVETGDFVQLPDPVATFEGKLFESPPAELAAHTGQPVIGILCPGNVWQFDVYPLEFEDEE